MPEIEKTDLVPYRIGVNTEPVPVGNLRLGEKWIFVQKQLSLIETAITHSELFSQSQDITMARSIFRLIDDNIERDRSSFFQEDLQQLIQEAKKQNWNDETINNSLIVLGCLYYESTEEMRNQIANFQVNTLLGRIPHPETQVDLWENSKQVRLHLYHFTDINLSATSDEVKIKMNPVYDGGIDDVAYPIRGITMVFKSGQALESDFSRQIWFFRSEGLNKELRLHPEIIGFLKDRFTQIVDMYRTNRQEFVDTRHNHQNKKDTTRINADLYEYMNNKYFPSNLTQDQLRQFNEAKKRLDSSEVEAIIKMRHLHSELLNPESFLNKNNFFAEDHKEILDIAKERTIKALGQLGCVFQDGEIGNAEKIIEKALRDKRYAKRILSEWDKIFKHPNTVMRMIEEEIESWAHIDWFDRQQVLYERALRWSRENKKNYSRIEK